MSSSLTYPATTPLPATESIEDISYRIRVLFDEALGLATQNSNLVLKYSKQPLSSYDNMKGTISQVYKSVREQPREEDMKRDVDLLQGPKRRFEGWYKGNLVLAVSDKYSLDKRVQRLPEFRRATVSELFKTYFRELDGDLKAGK